MVTITTLLHGYCSALKMASVDLPPQLKKLVRMVARTFYEPLHIVCLDVLSNYPCVAESDLVDVLRMNGSQKQLRQVLGTLRRDKLVKSMQKMETENESSSESNKHLKMIHYYYINYKEFVNVVKYKLDMMRKKIQSEGKTAHTRTTYVCTMCHSTYTELDIDRLYDPTLSILSCSHCKGPLEEDIPECGIDTGALMFRLNEQLKPIVDLLRETENVVLTSEVLEPTLQGIKNHLEANMSRRTSTGGSVREWSSQSVVDMYGGSTTISVNIGEEHHEKQLKEAPEWMRESTVHSEIKSVNVPEESFQISETQSYPTVPADHQIMSHLLAHEGKESINSAQPVTEEEPEYSSSSDENSAAGTFIAEVEEDSSEEEEFTVRIGNQVVPVNEVTSDMHNSMTDEEKEHYRQVYQLAMSQAEFC